MWCNPLSYRAGSFFFFVCLCLQSCNSWWRSVVQIRDPKFGFLGLSGHGNHGVQLLCVVALAPSQGLVLSHRESDSVDRNE